MGGTPGSGKSYVLKKLSHKNIEPRVVNTDTWTEFLKVGMDNEKWMKNADKTKQLTKNQLTLYLNSMLPLWIDGTSNKTSAIFNRKGALMSLGYDTAMVWVTTSLETALKRAKAREKSIQRHVDEDFIKELHRKAESMKGYYKTQFSTFLEVKNDDGELTDAVIKKALGKMTSFYDSPVQNPIGKELIKKMHKEGWKYLDDTDMYDLGSIKNALSTWYRK